MKTSTKIWVVAALAAVALAAFVAISVIFRPVNVNKYIINDYEDVLANRDSSALYYETQFVLEGYLDEWHWVLPNAKSYECVFQIPDTVLYYKRDFDADALEVSFDRGHWGGTFASDPREFKVTLNEAIKLIEEANIVKPHSDKVTLRWPLGSRYDHALYIFGSTTTSYYIYVDSITGEVGELDVDGNRLTFCAESTLETDCDTVACDIPAPEE